MSALINDGLPEAIFRAIATDKYDPGDCDYTPTSLNSPVLQRALLDKYGAEVERSASALAWAFFGSMVHAVLEHVEIPGAEKEVRLYADIAGKRIGGRFDLYCRKAVPPLAGGPGIPARTLIDFKVTSMWEVIFSQGKAKPDWEQQLNVLAELCRRNDRPVEHVMIIPIMRDWNRGRSEREADIPPNFACTIEAPLWASAADWIELRIAEHEAAKRGVLPSACSPEERWAKPTTFAVMKKGNKRAVAGSAKLSSHAEALDFIRQNGLDSSTHEVDVRPGEETRCVRYCDVARFCQFGKGLAIT